ncbi:hypothetical protein OBB02_03255 [Candidatus Puniceispirillum sp.]|nr:hypothetical protein [Candidatus Puniceispirillum sp.]
MILSIPKLLGLLAVIWLVWTAFRFFETRKKKRSNQSIDDGENKSPGEAGASHNETYETSVDLHECELCGVWYSGETCERENCPH